MIIFGLDGCLADCEHRRHFVDPKKRSPNGMFMNEERHESGIYVRRDPETLEATNEIWKPDWTAFYEACGEDKPIEPVIQIFQTLAQRGELIQIWSGRCESVRYKTLEWLSKHIWGWGENYFHDLLKMRPIGDNTPGDQLKARWLDEIYDEIKKGGKSTIDFVFEDDPKCIAMYRSCGIFVFNSCQHDGEF